MANIRWSLDPHASVRLRFDDAEFVDLCAGGNASEGDGEETTYGAVKRILGRRPEDVDFSAFVADGVWLQAREAITQREEGTISNVSQQEDTRKGFKVDIVRANARLFATWVTEIGADDEDARVPEGLSAPKITQREEAFQKLPNWLAEALLARLRVHVDAMSAPAARDPQTTTGKAESGSRRTTPSSNGVQAPTPLTASTPMAAE